MKGYRFVYLGRGHVNTEHLVKAQKVLGKPLPAGAEVHHINGDPSDNRRSNLVICQDSAYHHLLHQRQRALDACGNPGWRKCWVCKQWDDPATMTFKAKRAKNTGSWHHSGCYNEHSARYQRERRRKARAI